MFYICSSLASYQVEVISRLPLLAGPHYLLVFRKKSFYL